MLVAVGGEALAVPGYVIVCHPSNPAATLSGGDLKKAVTGGLKQWGNGAPVQVGISAGESPELQHLSEAAGMKSSDLLGRIQQQVFRGEMRRPVVVRSSAECVAFAKANAGAICAASAASVTGDVKVITVR
jgi:hypothetical protein